MQLEDVVVGLPPTEFAYWKDSYAQKHPGVIQRLIPEDKKNVYFALNSTIFHPKSGGQPSDKGTITGEGFRLQVKKSMLLDKHIVHWGKILEGNPLEGSVQEEIDWSWRFPLMKRHSAAHLFDHCLSTILGGEVETTDSWLGDPCYAGYKGTAPSTQRIEEASNLENSLIQRGLTIKTEVVSRKGLEDLASKAPNLWRLPELDEYRIVTIEGCTPIPCGGTHVRNVREIQSFQMERIEQMPDSFRVYFKTA